jgi:ABC-2 type transport system permease protein
MQFVDYPYFLDLREPGLNGEHPVTAGLPNLTLAWASPVEVVDAEGRTATPLLVSSPESWRSDARDVMPDVDPAGGDVLAPGGSPLAPETVGVLVQRRFESAFEEVPPAPEPAMAGEAPAGADGDFGGLLRRSPASARLLVIGSNDFASDQVLSGLVAASGTQYLSPVELLLGAVDWALADGSLLEIRSRAHFNRTLPPLEEGAQARIEYLNYGLALALLGLIALVHQLRQRQRRNRYRRVLA